MVERTSRMKSHVLPALALAVALPADGYGQAKIAPKWLECFAPNECEVRVFNSGLHGRKGRMRLLAERAAGACQAAGYSHYAAGTPTTTAHHIVQRAYFTNDDTPPARPCSFSGTAESEAEAKQIAEAKGYPWPVGQDRFNTEPAWTFDPGENDWGEPVPLLDEINAPGVFSKRSDQNIIGMLFLIRNCTVTLAADSRATGDTEDWWVYTDGQNIGGDRILEIRVDGVPVKQDGRNVTIPNAGMVASSQRTFGMAVRSAKYEDNAAFEWAVTPPDRALIEQHFGHCVESP